MSVPTWGINLHFGWSDWLWDCLTAQTTPSICKRSWTKLFVTSRWTNWYSWLIDRLKRGNLLHLSLRGIYNDRYAKRRESSELIDCLAWLRGVTPIRWDPIHDNDEMKVKIKLWWVMQCVNRVRCAFYFEQDKLLNEPIYASFEGLFSADEMNQWTFTNHSCFLVLLIDRLMDCFVFVVAVWLIEQVDRLIDWSIEQMNEMIAIWKPLTKPNQRSEKARNDTPD